MHNCFVVAGEHPVPDLIEWAASHPRTLGPDFEILAARLLLPGGRELPMLGALKGGAVALVDEVRVPEEAAVGRLAEAVGFLRRHPEWLARSFPGRGLHGFEAPRLVLLAPHFSPRFRDALAGLAVSEVVLLRVRALESAEGARLLLVEREDGAEQSSPAGVRAVSDLTEEEERFFLGLEAEWENARQGAGG